MQNLDRLWATITVWVSCTITTLGSIVALAITQPRFDPVFIVSGITVLNAIAGFSTFAIWRTAKRSVLEKGKTKKQITHND